MHKTSSLSIIKVKNKILKFTICAYSSPYSVFLASM